MPRLKLEDFVIVTTKTTDMDNEFENYWKRIEDKRKAAIKKINKLDDIFIRLCIQDSPLYSSSAKINYPGVVNFAPLIKSRNPNFIDVENGYSFYQFGSCRGYVNELINWYYHKNREDDAGPRGTNLEIVQEFFNTPKIIAAYSSTIALNHMLTDNNLMNMIHWLEEELGLEERSELRPTQFPNVLALEMPQLFVKASPLYSLYTHIIRAGVGYQGEESPKDFFVKKANGNGVIYNADENMKDVLEKIQLFKEYGIEPDDLHSWVQDNFTDHNWGINNCNKKYIVGNRKKKIIKEAQPEVITV